VGNTGKTPREKVREEAEEKAESEVIAEYMSLEIHFINRVLSVIFFI
jgi:hypothetical protein